MRIDGKGLVDRTQPVQFRFDGAEYGGFAGDTLASALLANGIRLFGRSFKYHRPRGVLTAGSEEPNALVTIGQGAAQTPNVRATQQEIYDGLNAVSQNAWPSLKRDMLAVNDLMSPFLGAGFYYKTFMWPRAFWERVYEPLIRRAAGLGALSGEQDTAHNDRAFAHCDLLIIGAGPAGLMAAITAARSGADVIVADEDMRMGGRLLAEQELVDGMPAPEWVARTLAELAEMPNVRLMPRTTVTGAYDQGTYGALERAALHLADPGDAPLETFWRIVARRALLCAGAIERPIAFPDNDRPGIMMASAVRAYLNRWGVAPGRRVAVFGNSDDAHRTAHDLAAAGVNVVAMIDTRQGASVPGDFPIFTGAEVIGTRGRHALSEIAIRHQGETHRIPVDCLAVSGGWNPTLHLTSHMGARPDWNAAIHAFVPRARAVPGMDAAGAALGVFSTKGAFKSGYFRARGLLRDLGFDVPSIPQPKAEDAAFALEPVWSVKASGRAWLDFQNDVTTKDVAQAAGEGFASSEHMKRYTTQGMATDQGKMSNVGALAVLADATARTIAETGTTTFRPPFTPVSIAALGAGGRGASFAPERLTTSHVQTTDLAAPMVTAGLWYRASYFPREGEGKWRQSVDREVQTVRSSVGICDVSTLGKIDIQGPDAARFLDFVYCNTMSTLKVGRVRYGLMLREDGLVMDDGTAARLGARHFVITTTTGAAGQVMSHLQFVHQVLCPKMDVSMISVTEQWAQFAVAGPQARDVLNAVLDVPVGGDDPTYMGHISTRVSGVDARLFRISFSGELGYEIAVPARFGASLFAQLVHQAEVIGGCLYGLEALNVLRIEKGFLTHSEMNGQTTASDLGLGRMVSTKKDCIGQAGAARPGLAEARQELVGLRPVGAVKMLTAGAHLFAPGDPAIRVNDQGHITSVGFSPLQGTFIGLGFLLNGRARHGEHVRMVDHMRQVEALCEVCSPVFYDPEGERLHV